MEVDHLHAQVFLFPGGFCLGDGLYFLTYEKEKVFIPFSPISLGILLNISWEFEQLPESCQYENSCMSIIVKSMPYQGKLSR